MTAFLEVFVFGALLGLPFLYETRPAFCYFLKMFLYVAYEMFISLCLIPILLIKAWNVDNLTFASYLCRWITHLIGIKWEVRNEERLLPEEPGIIVCNHQSSLDILGMFQFWPKMGRCTVIARREVFWVWPFGLAAWLAGLVFIPRVKTKATEAKAVIQRAVEKIAREKTKLWIFPEGTRRNTGEIHPFKKGAFHSAISAQLPVIPIVYSRYYFLDAATRRFDQGNIIIQVLDPINTKGLTLKDIDKLADEVRQKMTEVFNEISQEVVNYRLPTNNAK